MAAPKYIALTDHTAGHTYEDRTYELEATNILDAMDETHAIVADDETLYCVVIYERTKGCKGARYIYYDPILRAGKYGMDWNTNRRTGFGVRRETYRSTCWYNICEVEYND